MFANSFVKTFRGDLCDGHTAGIIVLGFLASLLGGTPYQTPGPTGPFFFSTPGKMQVQSAG